MLDVLVERVLGTELALEGDELLARVALVADEEEAGVELAGGRIDAVAEAVAPAEDADAVVFGWRRHADVRVGGDEQAALRVEGREIRRVVLEPAAERRARHLLAPDGLLLVLDRRAVPHLEQHADAAGHDVAAAAHPRRVVVVADPHVVAHDVAVFRLQVVGAVLHPHEVPRRLLPGARGGRTSESQLRPAHGRGAARDANEVVERVERDLRVVGTALHRDVAVAAERVEDLAARERRHLHERRRQPVGETDPVAAVRADEHAASEADRDREVRGRQADGLSGVVGCRARVGGGDGTNRMARGEQRGRSSPVAQQRLQRRPVVVEEVERAVEQTLLRGRRDTGLVGAAERDERALGERGRACIRLRRAADVAPGQPRDRAHRRELAGRAEHFAS